MANQGLGPWQIAELDIHLINEVFRQIEQQLNLLRGLGPTVSSSGVVSSGTITIGAHNHTSSANGGVLNHDTALTGISANDHHTQAHIHDGDSSGTVDSGAITYNPANNDKWNGAIDPGNLADAVNQLAQRVAELEQAVDTVGHARITDQIFAGSGLTFIESDESNTITITVP